MYTLVGPSLLKRASKEIAMHLGKFDFKGINGIDGYKSNTTLEK